MQNRFKVLPLLLITLLLTISAVVFADTEYDEAVDGDLSDDRLAPTLLAFTEGSNTLTATTVGGDRDYFTIQIPAGLQLDALFLDAFVSDDDLSFIAMQGGTPFTEPPTGTDVANLLGYGHFGTGNDQVGTDILDDLAAGPGAIGFVAPLPAGDYSFWVQELSAVPVTYKLNFQVSQAVYDEAVDGDLSGDWEMPTPITLAVGSNLVSAISVAGDLEYFTTAVPFGHQLKAVYLTAYASTDDTAFIAVQKGTNFTEPPTGTNVANLLGYTHFGPSLAHVGTDILDDIAAGNGAIGFTPPLGAGAYTFWSQQTGPAETNYTFNFVVTESELTYVFLPLITR